MGIDPRYADTCKIEVCLNKSLDNGFCSDHQSFANIDDDLRESGKHLQLLLERIDRKEIIEFASGVNGLIAVTASTVYLVRGAFLERKAVKSYFLKNISSIELRKPNMITNGHFQILASGSKDRTSRNSSAFTYAKDENTVMLRSEHYEPFLEIEQLIYRLRDSTGASHTSAKQEDDVFTKIEKLADLRERNLISAEEFETKKSELLAQI